MCERCLKDFSQKSHYNKHLNKKRPCQDNKGKIEEIVENLMNHKKLISNTPKYSVQKNQTGMKHELGQYFTTNEELRKTVLEFILNNPDTILEPSVGRGDLVKAILQNNNKIHLDMYEIDTSIEMLDGVPKNIIYGDFLKQVVKKKYKTIVGNPPFVRTRSGNLYIDFVEKCYNLLENDGELIFIIPSDFFKLTSASKLLNTMIINGSFTHIYHPHKENLFENASIDVLVFRYYKNSSIEKEVLYNNNRLFIINNEGLITFNKSKSNSVICFKEYFDIYVGLVSGKESIYKNKEYGNIDVLNGENQMDRYIYIEEFPCNNPSVNHYLSANKDVLINRKIRKFNETNWFEWGAPRNIKSIKSNLGKECIYVYNLTRKAKIAFKGEVSYFGGGLIILIPKKDVNLDNIVSYLNSQEFKNNFMFSGRFKIGHRQISNSYIPNSYL